MKDWHVDGLVLCWAMVVFCVAVPIAGLAVAVWVSLGN